MEFYRPRNQHDSHTDDEHMVQSQGFKSLEGAHGYREAALATGCSRAIQKILSATGICGLTMPVSLKARSMSDCSLLHQTASCMRVV